MNTTGLDELLEKSADIPETLSFYNGEVILRYNDRLHVYYLEEDGVKYLVPGSTSIGGKIDKSGPLTQWAANMTVALIRERLNITAQDAIGYVAMDIGSLNTMLEDARFNFRSIQKEATDIGNEAHLWLENYIKAQIAKVPYNKPLPHEDPDVINRIGEEGAKKASNCVNAALDWFSRHHVEFYSSECKVFSREFFFAGTADWFARVSACGDRNCCPFHFERAHCCGDFKSSRALYDEYRIQLASYVKARNEEFPDDPVTIRVLMRLDKDGNGVETVVMPPEELEADFECFLGAMAIYNWFEQMRLDKRFEKDLARAKKKAEKEREKAAKPKRTRKPRKVVVKDAATELIPVEGDGFASIPVEGFEPIPVEA